MSSGKDSSSSYSAPALEKGLRIIEDLAAARQAQSLAEFAQSQSRTPSELFRMLNCLETMGYVIRDPVSGKFTLSLKLHHLAQQQPKIARLTQVAESAMQELARETGESCHLCILEGSRVVIVLQTEGSGHLRLSFNTSIPIDPFETTSGRFLASRLDAEQLEILLADSEAFQRMSDAGQDETRRELGKLARRSIHQRNSTTVQGVRDLCAIIGSASTIWASLAITRLMRRDQGRAETESTKKALAECAAQISARLGG